MPTQAIAAYGTQVRLGDGVPLAPLTINTVTNTTPITVSTALPHTVADVSWAVVSGVGGTTAANGAWIVERVTNTTLRLRDSQGNGGYTGGGTVTLQSTFASIAELRNADNVGSRKDLVDVSAHDGNGYSSEVGIFKRTQGMRLEVNFVPDEPTHDHTTGLLALFNSGASRHWLLVVPPATPSAPKPAGHLYGFVDYFTNSYPVNGVLGAEVTLAFEGAFTWTTA